MAYVWICSWDNNASDWKDSERCVAVSRKTYCTEEEARKAADRHERSSRHYGRCHTKNIGRKKWHK
jgi:hypothetical protein